METTIVRDEFGPEYVLRVTDAKLGMEGFLIIDNTALGPGKGGMRMTPDVSAHEVFRLARTMTWKNAMAGIPFGGAKSGIVWPSADKVVLRQAQDVKQAQEIKREFIQSFARALRHPRAAREPAGRARAALFRRPALLDGRRGRRRLRRALLLARVQRPRSAAGVQSGARVRRTRRGRVAGRAVRGG